MRSGGLGQIAALGLCLVFACSAWSLHALAWSLLGFCLALAWSLRGICLGSAWPLLGFCLGLLDFCFDFQQTLFSTDPSISSTGALADPPTPPPRLRPVLLARQNGVSPDPLRLNRPKKKNLVLLAGGVVLGVPRVM